MLPIISGKITRLLCAVTTLALTSGFAGAAPKAYVANFADNTVSVIDTAAGKVVATVPVAAGPHGMAITQDGRTVYVAGDTGYGDGRIFLESERDIYRKGAGGIDAVKALARAGGIGNLVDWSRAGEVLNDQEGIAREVTLGSERARGTPADPIAATTSERTPTAATTRSSW